jgi:isoquinoline 1-oxidoreductase subunit beta
VTGGDLRRPLRRHFLKMTAIAGGGLMLGLTVPMALGGVRAASASQRFAPGAFIRIDREGVVTLIMPMVEMGQGTYTSLPMLLAEELDVGLDQVRLEHAPANDALYANVILHVQSTGLSSSIRAFWTPLRQAGTAARSVLIAAAAQRWRVDAATCRTHRGTVFDAAGSRSLSYGDLVDAAAALPLPAPGNITLKDPKDFILIGTPARRLDTSGKVNRAAKFGIDAWVPGMKVATVAQSPVFGGKVRALDEAAALAVKGVRQVVRLEDAVAVVADHMGAAKKGLAAGAVQWDEGANAKVGQSDIFNQLREAVTHPGVDDQRKLEVLLGAKL